MTAAVPALAGVLSADEVLASARWIAATQRIDGAIPWYDGGPLDVWDHVECAMALTAAGMPDAGRRALAWSVRSQRPDGTWPARTIDGVVEAGEGDTNHGAYLAVGVWHHVLVTGDLRVAVRCWPAVAAALDLVVAVQRADGTVPWNVDAEGRPADGALLTGNCSIYHSLRCGIALADALGHQRPAWALAAAALGDAIRSGEDFLDKQRYAMDWYYPVLGGAVRGTAARERLAGRWEEFVVPSYGVNCVSDQPWVTGGETCELVLALDAVGEVEVATRLLGEVQHLREPDGSYWTGYQHGQRAIWPDEHTTWTAAAVILAVDALSRTTPGSGIFRDAIVDVDAAVAAAAGNDVAAL